MGNEHAGRPSGVPHATAPGAACRPKHNVDWSVHKLRCPRRKLHGTFATLDAFMTHVQFDCDAIGDTSRSRHFREASASSTDSASTGAAFPDRPPMVHTGFLDGDVDAGRLSSRSYTVAVTVSPGNKWYTVANTLRLIDFAVNVTDGPIVVTVSDTINCLNRGVKDKSVAAGVTVEEAWSRTFQAALVGAIAVDQKLAAHAHRITTSGYCAWLGTEQARADRDAVMLLYDADDDFAAAVHAFVEPWCHKPWRATTDFHRACAVQYFLEELASLTVTTNADGVPELEVYADSNAFGWCAARTLVMERLFAGRARRHHACFAADPSTPAVTHQTTSPAQQR